jgi:hypothetical protein
LILPNAISGNFVRPRELAHGNPGDHRCASTWRGGDGEFAANHLQTFSHAEQSQAVSLIRIRREFLAKAFAVVYNFHTNRAVGVVNF